MPGKQHYSQTVTLQLKWPIDQTFGLTVLILILLMGLLEIATRTAFVQAHLPAPGLGSGIQHLEVKAFRLQEFAEKEGGVDCIFLGASTVNRGIDPDVFQKAYSIQTHKSIRCFNFGVPGITPVGAKDLAEILVDMYHPGLLVLGSLPANDTVKPAEENLDAN